MTDHIALLTKLNACYDAIAFAEQFDTLADAWDACERPDWMLWLHHNGNGLIEISDKDLRLFACDCVRRTPITEGRTVWDLLTDERLRNAVEVAERYANGEATSEELDAARAAARDADSDAARAAARAASWDADSDAARAAARAVARDTALATARAAARAAARDAAWATARDAARDAARAFQADLLRKRVGNPFREARS